VQLICMDNILLINKMTNDERMSMTQFGVVSRKSQKVNLEPSELSI